LFRLRQSVVEPGPPKRAARAAALVTVKDRRGLDANPAPFARFARFARALGGRCEHDGHCGLSANACTSVYKYVACA
jgi:hypothetical protein